MTTYDNFKKVRVNQRRTANSKISEALKGLSPKTADLIFDLSDRDDKKLDINKNAAIKAMELVSNLLSKFNLPSKPILEYHGIIKNAMNNGILFDGVVKVGASIITLMGHKANIDVPVIIRNQSLLEPAIFFYNEAPYVMCGPAFDELVKCGTLMGELQPRQIFSGPISDKESMADKPRVPRANLPHMFSPGIRNPWTFRRYSSVQEELESIPGIVNPWIKDAQAGGAPSTSPTTAEEEDVQEGEDTDKLAAKEPRKRTNIDTDTEIPEVWPADLPEQHLDQAERTKEGLIPVGSKVKLTKDCEVRNRGGGTIILPSGEEGTVIRDEKGDGMCLYVDFCEMGIKEIIHYQFLKKATTSSGFILSQIQEQQKSGYDDAHITQFIQDQYGRTEPEATQEALNQSGLGQKMAATAAQVRNRARDMLREGYQSVDIQAVIEKQYPEHAKEALEGITQGE